MYLQFLKDLFVLTQFLSMVNQMIHLIEHLSGRAFAVSTSDSGFDSWGLNICSKAPDNKVMHSPYQQQSEIQWKCQLELHISAQKIHLYSNSYIHLWL